MSKAIKRRAASTLPRERMYDVILAPVITEKATNITGNRQYTFKVPLVATKPEIRAAIEGLFGVNVTAVNTIVHKGKTKRFRGIIGRRSDTKKAMVTLIEGQRIDVTTGV
ncbi:MAG: 50S ribosomal protein L23 [Rhodospirillaceae bacterium]